MMFRATSSAISGSRMAQPVSITAPTPIVTPTEVHTSVIRWCESASSVIERYFLLALSSTRATPKFTAEASTEIARPTPTCSSGCGASRRGMAAQTMLAAASKISAPSTPLAKYSAFPWP